MKSHAYINFEEFTTVLTQIESSSTTLLASPWNLFHSHIVSCRQRTLLGKDGRQSFHVKWHHPTRNMQIGDVQEDNMVPTKWPR